MEQIGANMEDAFTIDADAFANAIEMNMDENELTELLRSMMTAEDASFDGNLNSFGYADLSKPAQIDIYPLDFESKESIAEILGAYNSRMTGSGQEEKVISYTDLVGTMMSSMTEIVNTISYVLVALWQFPGGLLHHDRCDHLYQCVGAKKRDRHPSRHWRVQGIYPRCSTRKPSSSACVRD